jgi:hypothetical protein
LLECERAEHGAAVSQVPRKWANSVGKQTDRISESVSQQELLEFLPDRSDENADGTDIYGCARATREGEAYTGIAVVHAVHEHATWTFTGWSFTEFPNLSCKLLADPSWKPAGRMGWDQPMEEVRNVNAPSKP